MEYFKNATKCLCSKLYGIVQNVPDAVKYRASEIRIRTKKNIVINLYNGESFVIEDKDLPYLTVSQEDIYETFKNICNYSVYSYQEQIKNGYITYKGGHRIGICGTAVISSQGNISNIKSISSLNIRISREIKGISDKIFESFSYNIESTLFVGKPGSGKTTILRDLAYKLSVERLKKVSIVDERGEIGSVYEGIPQKDIGYCDVLDGYPKGEGILQAVRVLSPEYIICDEIGNKKDVNSIIESVNTGVKFIASVHSGSIEELLNREQVKILMEAKVFRYIVLLENGKCPGERFKIYKVDELDV